MRQTLVRNVIFRGDRCNIVKKGPLGGKAAEGALLPT
jgi:hypothetical protein